MAFRRRRRFGRVAAADAGRRDRLRRALERGQIEPDQRAHQPDRAGARLAHARPHPRDQFLRRTAQSRARGPARLRLRQGAEGKDRSLDRAGARLSRRPRQPRPRSGADRRAPWPQAQRRRGARRARPRRGELRHRSHQGRRIDQARARESPGRDHGGDRQAAGGLSDRFTLLPRTTAPGFPSCAPPSCAYLRNTRRSNSVRIYNRADGASTLPSEECRGPTSRRRHLRRCGRIQPSRSGLRRGNAGPPRAAAPVDNRSDLGEAPGAAVQDHG